MNCRCICHHAAVVLAHGPACCSSFGDGSASVAVEATVPLGGLQGGGDRGTAHLPAESQDKETP